MTGPPPFVPGDPERKLGPIITGLSVLRAARDTVNTWFPSYIAEIGGLAGYERSDLPPFRSYTTATELNTWPESQIPACVLVVPGLRDQPVKKSTGYDAEWSLGLGAVVSSLDQDMTLELVMLYVSALRACILQHQSLGLGARCKWLDEGYDGLKFDDSRTIGAGIVYLGVSVSGVVDSAQGLPVPPEDPVADPGYWGRVESADVTVKGKMT